MILTFTPNPCVDKTVFIDELRPGEKIRASRYGCVPGGKGNNVARSVKTLGWPVKAMVIVGGHTGHHVVDMIQHDDKVPCTPVWVDSPTRTITTVLEESIHRQTAFFEPGSALTLDEVEAVVAAFGNAIKGVEVAVLSGTVSDRILEGVYRDVIPMVREAGAMVILDSHGPEFALGIESVPDMVKPNVEEAAKWFGQPLDTQAARWEAIDAMHAKGVALVVMSLGKEGALVSSQDHGTRASRPAQRLEVTPPAIKEVNPVGSGDALVAAFAIGLMEGWPLEKMAEQACAAGAANAGSWDIGHFSMDEVESLAKEVQIRAV